MRTLVCGAIAAAALSAQTFSGAKAFDDAINQAIQEQDCSSRLGITSERTRAY